MFVVFMMLLVGCGVVFDFMDVVVWNEVLIVMLCVVMGVMNVKMLEEFWL